MISTTERKEELQLLSAVLEGDTTASTSFFYRYNPTIEMCVRRILKRSKFSFSEEDIRDLVNDIWVSLLEHDMRPLRRFEPQREIQLKTWISLLARNKTIDRLRSLPEELFYTEDVDRAKDLPSPRPLPTDELEGREYSNMVRDAMQKLTPEDRSFFLAWYTDNCDPIELAHQFGISIGTVYSRRFKIQAKLSRFVRRFHCYQGATSHTLH